MAGEQELRRNEGSGGWGCHIAAEIGKPVLVRRASDIQDKYVVESEKSIALMFDNARQ